MLLLVLINLYSVLAYIDPGTAGTIIGGSIWPFILGVLVAIGAFFVKYFFKPIKRGVFVFMGKNKRKKLIKPLFIILIIILGVVFSLVFLGERMVVDSKYKRVLVIGIDAMDPKITDKLMSEGKLPNFKKLAGQGSFMSLNTSYPPHSPVAWTSIATGVNPGKHNIFDFIRRNPETYLPVLSLLKSASGISGTNYESYVKANPFWRITSNAGIPTTLIRWPVSFPPERIKGNLLSGLGVPDVKGFLSGYTYYTTKEIGNQGQESNKIIQVEEDNNIIETEIFGPKTKKSGEIVDIKAFMRIRLNENSADIVIEGKTYSVTLNDWSDWIRAKFKVDFLKSVYGIFKVHLISLDPFEMYITAVQIDPENPLMDISYPAKYSSRLAKEIGLYYTLGMPEETDGYIDDRISKEVFLEQINQLEEERGKMFWKEFKNFKEGVFAFVFDSSDRVQHMFWDAKVLEDENLSVNEVVAEYYSEKDIFLGEVLEQIDDATLLLIVSDHGFTSFERAVSMNRWLVDNGFMVLSKDINDEEAPLFQFVDWSKTKAYSLGFNSVYINLRGRERKGVVDDREKVVDDIIAKLENFTDKKTGKKVVNKAYRREDIYKGNHVEDAPDIIIGFNPGYRMSWQTAVGGFTKDVLTDNVKKWKGDHLVDPLFVPGVLFSNIKFNKLSASQIDVAPTILDALGVKIPEEIDGKSLLR